MPPSGRRANCPRRSTPQRDRALLASFEVDPADLEEDLGGQSPAVG
jgi:hypothetical protein